jgi:hypothetical protein
MCMHEIAVPQRARPRLLVLPPRIRRCRHPPAASHLDPSSFRRATVPSATCMSSPWMIPLAALLQYCDLTSRSSGA